MSRESYYVELGKRLRSARIECGLNMAAAAALVGKTIPTISKYETGDIPVPCDIFMQLCGLYGIGFSPADVIRSGVTDSRTPVSGQENMLWVYWCRGREHELKTSLLKWDNASGAASLYLYYHPAEPPAGSDFVYTGSMSANSYSMDFCLQNCAAPFDFSLMSFQAMACCGNGHQYMKGIISGITFSYQNVALKAVASPTPIGDENFLTDILKLNADDCSLARSANAFIVN